MSFLNRILGSAIQIWGQTQRSPQWGAVRDHWVKSNPCCAGCGAIFKLEAHHIVPFHVERELELSEQNLVTLCRECHFQIGHMRDWSLFNPQVIADAAVYKNRYNEARNNHKPY